MMHHQSSLALAITFMLLAAPANVATAAPGAAAGDAAAGQKTFNRLCRVCHQVDATLGSASGPNLAGIAGRSALLDAAFVYSDPFKNAAAKGLVWNVATLDRFLAAPTKMIPDTKMPMAVPNATQRRDLVAYLSTLKP